MSNNSRTKKLTAGWVMLRPGKRPRPMVLRMNVGDCLEVNFTNLLAKQPVVSTSPFPATRNNPYDPNDPKFEQWQPDNPANRDAQPVTREAGVHAMGMQLCPVASQAGILSDASWDGANPNSLVCPLDASGTPTANCLVGPGVSTTYKFYAEGEGAFLLYSTGANVGQGTSFGGQLTHGLFGSIAVQPEGAEWYRSQVTALLR